MFWRVIGGTVRIWLEQGIDEVVVAVAVRWPGQLAGGGATGNRGHDVVGNVERSGVGVTFESSQQSPWREGERIMGMHRRSSLAEARSSHGTLECWDAEWC